MRYFIAVAEKQGVSRAAAELHITQQTLSAHMAALERELGCRLFQRRPAFKLTYAGEVFLAYCRRYDSMELAMRSEFADIESGRGAEIRLGIAHTRGKVILPRAIARFRRARPGVRFMLCEDTNERLEARLMEDELDMMIGLVPPETPELTVESLYTERVCALFPPGLAGRADTAKYETLHAALDGCPLLLSDGDDILGRVSRALLDEAGIAPRFAVQSRNVETLLKLCAEGAGVCFCTESLTVGALGEDERAPLAVRDTGREYTVSASWKARAYVSRAITEFAALLKEEIKK